MEYTRTNWEAINEGEQEHSVPPLSQQLPGEHLPGPEFQDRSLEMAGSDLLLGC